MDRGVLDRLLLHCGSLSSIYHQAPETFIRGAKPKHLHSSPALDPSVKRSFLESLNLPQHIPPEQVVSTVPSSYTNEPPSLPPKPTNGATQGQYPLDLNEEEEDTYAEIAAGSQDPYAALSSFGQGGLGRQFMEEEGEADGEKPILGR
jgi:AP-2 complex subunit beta-1